MKQTKNIVLSLVLLLMFITPSVCALETNDWEGYYSDWGIGTGYYVKYPKSEGWELIELAPNSVALVSPTGMKVAVMFAIQDIRLWGHESLTLDEYVKIYDENLSKKMIDYKVVEREESELSGIKAYKAMYTYTDNIDRDWHVKNLIYTLMVDGVWAYDVGYSATPDTFEGDLEVAEAIMRFVEIFQDE